MSIPNLNYEKYYEEKTFNIHSDTLDYEKNAAEYDKKIIITLGDIYCKKVNKKSKKPILKNTLKLIEGITDFNFIKNSGFRENKRFFMRKRTNVDYSTQEKANEFDLSIEDNSSDFEKSEKIKKDK